MPASFADITSGSIARRVLADTTKPFSWPDATCSDTLTDCSHMKSTWPPTTSFIAGPLPR
jgi:hypothetical protein